MCKLMRSRTGRIIAKALIPVFLLWTLPPASAGPAKDSPREQAKSAPKSAPPPDIQVLKSAQMKSLRGSDEEGWRNAALCGKREWWDFVRNVNVTIGGNLYLEWTDLQVSAPGIPVVFTRSYNSNEESEDENDRPFGIGWSYSYCMYVDYCPTEEDPNQLVSTSGSGTRTYMHRNADGYYRSEAWDHNTYTSVYKEMLTPEGDITSIPTKDQVTTKDGMIIYYQPLKPTGTTSYGSPKTESEIIGEERRYVTRICTRHTTLQSNAEVPTNAMLFTYYDAKLATVTDTIGRSVTVNWNSGGTRITSVSTGSGDYTRTVQYAYDSAGNLSTVTSPAGREVSLTYYTPSEVGDEEGVLQTVRDKGQLANDSGDDHVITYEYQHGGTSPYQYFRVSYIKETDDSQASGYRGFRIENPEYGRTRVGAVVDGSDHDSDYVDALDYYQGAVSYGYGRPFDSSILDCSSPYTKGLYIPKWYGYAMCEGSYASPVYPCDTVIGGDPELSGAEYETCYDSLDRVTKRTRVAAYDVSQETNYTYSCVDKNGDPASYTYDDPVFGTSHGNSWNQPWCMKDPEGHLAVNYYDKFGKVLVTYDAETLKADGFPQDPYVPDDDFPCIRFAYNVRGQVTEMKDSRYGNAPDGDPFTTTYTYDTAGINEGALIQVARPNPDATNPNDPNDPNQARKTIMEYDSAGRMVHVTDPNDRETILAYNLDGQPTSVTLKDAQDNVETTMSYQYYANGLTKLVDVTKGQTTTRYMYKYYASNALKSVSDPTDSSGNTAEVTYYYDQFGNRTSMTVSGISEPYTYEYNLPSLSSVTSLTITDPRGFKTYYHADDMYKPYPYTGDYISNFVPCLGYVPVLSYSETKRPGEQGSEIVRAIYNCFNEKDRVYEKTNKRREVGGAHTVSTFRFTAYPYDTACVGAMWCSYYDKDMNKTATDYSYDYTYDENGLENPGETRHLTYEYNDVHALTQVDYDDAGAVNAYTYDFAGNRLTRKEAGDVVEQYEYDAAMQLRTLKDGQGSTLKSYTYDSVGNLTSDGTKTYTWDCMNRLISIAQTGQPTVYYTYRPDGLRATKQIGTGSVTRYVYDGQNLIAEKDGSNDLQTSYTIGKGEVISRTDWSGETPATVFFLYDGNCNVDAVVDEGGNLVKQFTYDVFGAVRETLVGSGAETVGFSGGIGHITDLENSLVYMRARYYDPSIGRFISEDPGRNGLNWYVYCRNNPVNMVDASGENPILVGIVIAAVLSGLFSCIFTGDWSLQRFGKGALYGGIAAAIGCIPGLGTVGAGLLSAALISGIEQFVYGGDPSDVAFAGLSGFGGGIAAEAIGAEYARQAVIALLLGLGEAGTEAWDD